MRVQMSHKCIKVLGVTVMFIIVCNYKLNWMRHLLLLYSIANVFEIYVTNYLKIILKKSKDNVRSMKNEE